MKNENCSTYFKMFCSWLKTTFQHILNYISKKYVLQPVEASYSLNTLRHHVFPPISKTYFLNYILKHTINMLQHLSKYLTPPFNIFQNLFFASNRYSHWSNCIPNNLYIGFALSDCSNPESILAKKKKSN